MWSGLTDGACQQGFTLSSVLPHQTRDAYYISSHKLDTIIPFVPFFLREEGEGKKETPQPPLTPPSSLGGYSGQALLGRRGRTRREPEYPFVQETSSF